MRTTEQLTRSPEETAKVAEELARSLSPGTVIGLRGELGSGKTTFVQGLAKGLGVTANVNSPTYMIVNEFEGRIPLYHVDFYRINSVEEVYNLGLEDYFFGEGVTVIEWADRFPDVLPEGARDVEFLTQSVSVRAITMNVEHDGSIGR